MRNTTTAAVTVCLLAALAGCAGGDDKSAARPSSSASASKTASATPPPPKPVAPFTVGKRWQWDKGTAQGYTTVLGYEQPVQMPIPAEAEGYVWATLEVKVCTESGDQTTVSQLPWSLAHEDGAREQPPGVAGPGMPKPEYPIADTVVRVGDCVRGKIPFEVPGDGWPERAVYAPGGFSGVVEWRVPAK